MTGVTGGMSYPNARLRGIDADRSEPFPGVGDGVDKLGKGDVLGGVGSTLGGVSIIKATCSERTS